MMRFSVKDLAVREKVRTFAAQKTTPYNNRVIEIV